MSDPAAIRDRLEAEGIRQVELRFTDLAGRWRRTALAAAEADGRLLEEGLLIDGGQLPGWRDPSEPDLLLRPDLATAFQDPFAPQPTLVLICEVAEPASGLGYARDPRSAARQVEEHLGRDGQGLEVKVALDLDFQLFDALRTEVGDQRTMVELAGGELAVADLAAGARRGGRLASPPTDQATDLRAEIGTILSSLGFTGLRWDHGAAAHQARLAFHGGGLVAAADRLMLAKDVIRQVAASYGKAACFMAQALPGGPGNGLAVQLALWQAGRPVFAGHAYADLSPMCLAFVAGVLAHGPALNALTNPSTNSYRRLRAGAEAPRLLAYAAFNRSAAIRIPFARLPAAKAVEIRFPDPLANPYLALAALVLAGMDGVARKLDPGEAMDRNLYDLPPAEAASLPATASDLGAALAALQADRGFLLQGDGLWAELLDAYDPLLRQGLAAVERCPHPLEFELYDGA